MTSVVNLHFRFHRALHFPPVRVRFNDFVLDTDRRELWRGTESVSVRPKALQLLQILVENRPKAMAQDELYDRLWPDTIVEKTSLHKVIHQLREVLDDREQTIIRTVYGFGFSFAATAVDETPQSPATHWQVVIGGRTFDLREGENVIGRERDAVISLDEPSISRRHARIIVSGAQITLEDLGSKNGTSLQGKRIRLVTLSRGDIIHFGNVVATLRELPAPRSTETAQ